MGSNINTSTGEYESDEGRSPRFTSWLFLLFCSCVTLSSAVQVQNDMTESNKASKWAIGGSILTLIVSFFLSLGHLHPISSSLIVGSIFEGISAFVLVAVWAAVVSIVTKIGNGLGVVQSETNQVGNGNLYYFSWGGFVVSIILFFSYLRSARGLDVVGALKGRGERLTHWAGYLAASIVIVGSSARVFNDYCMTGSAVYSYTEEYCKRTKFAISVGAIGLVLSLGIIGMKLFLSSSYDKSERYLALLLTAIGAAGVGVITSNKGPGHAIGNLYYFSWIGFILAGMIVVECFTTKQPEETAENGTNSSKAEVPLETMDEI